ncbi:MAG: hypothetical protein AAF215_28130 [Cyanobacteria bacterium P01_A01_bin.123]
MRIKPLLVKTTAGVMLIFSAIAVFAALPEDATETNWQSASHAPSKLLDQVVSDNLPSDLSIDATQMQVWEIQLAGQPAPLYLIDTRVADNAEDPAGNPLCGALGCAFFGYVLTDGNYEKVLDAYFKPELPPEVPLFELAEALQNDLPVLKVNQLEGDQIQQFTLVFNNGQYENVEIQTLPQRYE